MSRTRIKICGIRTPEIAHAAAAAGANWIGLVFVKQSPRYLSAAEAQTIVNTLPSGVEPVGLFVDEPAQTVREIVRQMGLNVVQLHGRETPDDAASLAPLRVFKALSFGGPHDLTRLQTWRKAPGNVAAILIDAPPAHGLTGGTGTAVDWSALAALRQRGQLEGLPPIILAGGLTPENVGQAIRLVHPFAVDVSSGVESTRGVKDARLIDAFCNAVREADAASQ